MSNVNEQINITPANSLRAYFRGNSQEGVFARHPDLFGEDVTTTNIGKKAFDPGILLKVSICWCWRNATFGNCFPFLTNHRATRINGPVKTIGPLTDGDVIKLWTCEKKQVCFTPPPRQQHLFNVSLSALDGFIKHPASRNSFPYEQSAQ